jgi:lipopolysaccharide biosynthesis glycosyltransferase
VIQIFAGYDGREAVGYHTFCQSVIDRCSEPVSITPLSLQSLGKIYGAGQKDGTNAFIYSRFLVPYLMGYNGWALFVDGCDMLCRADIAELWALRNPFKAVQVVKHDYQTKNPVKYIGTTIESANEDYPKKNWSSVMLINCSHYNWRNITPEAVERSPGYYLHRFQFIDERYIGEIPIEWNWLADEYGANEKAKLLHWTCGMPGFTHYKDAMHSEDWHLSHARANHAVNRKDMVTG